MLSNSIVLMFSGGLDSTAALHCIINDPLYVGFNVHLHHVKVITFRNRHDSELKSVVDIYQYYNNIRDLTISYSSIEVPIECDKAFVDSYLTMLLAGCFAKDRNVSHIAYGRNSTDNIRNSNSDIRKVSGGIYDSFNTGKEILRPVAHLSKLDCYMMLPEEVRSLTFSCRRPKDGSECGRCIPCKDLSNIRKSLL